MLFAKKKNPKYLILENDATISMRLKKWSDVEMRDKTVVTMFQACGEKELKDYLSTNSVLVFEPTKINFGQYNRILCVMRELAKNKNLGITDVFVFAPPSIEERLHLLWEDRTELNVVLKQVKVYSVNPLDLKRIKISI